MSDSLHSVVICYSLCPYEILPLDDKTKYTCMEEMNGWDDERDLLGEVKRKGIWSLSIKERVQSNWDKLKKKIDAISLGQRECFLRGTSLLNSHYCFCRIGAATM